MSSAAPSTSPPGLKALLAPIPSLDLAYDAASRSLWMSYKADGPPHYTLEVLEDIARLRDRLVAFLEGQDRPGEFVRYLVMASNKPGVFNLGGDLAMFAKAVREKDRAALSGYAHQCVELVHGLATGFGLPIVTVAVVAGRAFGGGMEAALAEDFLIASPCAQLGVPEVAFNSFPGMGAVTMLSRRLGAAQAGELISSGAIYGGRELYDIGVVDVLADDPDPHAFALRWLADGGQERFARRLALVGARRTVFPLDYDELIRVTDLWVDCCCEVTPHDVRHMERLASAQKRLLSA